MTSKFMKEEEKKNPVVTFQNKILSAYILYSSWKVKDWAVDHNSQLPDAALGETLVCLGLSVP